MALLVSAKGSDVNAWRAAEDFIRNYRQQLLNRLEYCRSEESEQLLTRTSEALKELAAANDAFCLNCRQMTADAASCQDHAQLKGLTTSFYSALYDHFLVHRSAPAFYQESSEFLKALAASVWMQAENRLGLCSRKIPRSGLIALGAAGRHEFSPFNTLQLILVHDHCEHYDAEIITQFGKLLHEGFEACGLLVDNDVTPMNTRWNGSIEEWRQRLLMATGTVNQQGWLDLFRLADQAPLVADGWIDAEFGQICRKAMTESYPAMVAIMKGVTGLPHGIGIMGGLRLEKNAPYRGMLAILESCIKPLSATISATALLKGLDGAATGQRIREILWRREMNVETAERIFQAWHNLNELRLLRESEVHPDWANAAPHYLEPDQLPPSEQEILRTSLETVATAQRYAGQLFNGMAV